MTKTFSISIREWLGPGDGTAAQRATNAEIAIRCGEASATHVEDFISKTVRSTIRVSAEPIAKWILANWWRLNCETEPVLTEVSHDWAMSHSMAAIGEGYVWPDLVFRGSDGSQISVECKRHLSVENEKFSPVRFLNSFRTTISVTDFESSARGFVEAVLARLADLGIRRSELHDLWNDLSTEWANPAYSSHRRLEALLGLEPDEDDALVAAVLKWGRLFGTSAAEEIAAEAKSKQIAELLNETKSLANATKTFADIHDLKMMRDTIDSFSQTGLPWQQAQALAYALREKWGFGDEPISDEDLADRLSLQVTKLRETTTDAPLSFGVRGKADGKLGLRINRSQDQGRRFDTARLIGGFIGFDDAEKIIPATNAMTKRQKFQRAFAAEFLCPSRMIQKRYSNVDPRNIAKAVDEMSTDYKVSKQVVIHHMENRKVLPQELSDTSLLLA